MISVKTLTKIIKKLQMSNENRKEKEGRMNQRDYICYTSNQIFRYCDIHYRYIDDKSGQ